MKKHYHQGDVSLHQIDTLPENFKEIEHNEVFVLVEGETTGSQHQLKGQFQIFQNEKGEYILQSNGCEIRHWNKNTNQLAEHNTETIKKGYYIVKHEQDYSPFEEEIRKSQD